MDNRVSMWEEDIIIPTYPVGTPNKNPMFLEKRVYQGSSGKVYPHSVIDKIYDEKVDKSYHGVYLENKYLKVLILPELGGRIHRATDKTNNYDFVYYNHVIKPALVGLAGPWISGGIEFNWPQHHRPSTFDPLSYKLECNEDGSCTVWVSEVENMFRTKGMAGFTLYPDKAYIKITAQLYNRTPVPQTFLWWANPAVPVNEHTQSVFPPDVHAVMDHGKRDVSRFPIATGTYYKVDYSAGVDISRYKNIPVPTSYMAYKSEYNFVGGYDYHKNAGILHVADHHISPGKKQWTWGCGEFGQAWDRNLTDEDGPYVELMTGCFTDNQPDFSWMAPYEEKVFTQYFMPYKKVGMVKNATVDVAIGLEVHDNTICAAIYVTGEQPGSRVVISIKGHKIAEEVVDLSPETAFEKEYTIREAINKNTVKIYVFAENGEELISYQNNEEGEIEIPEPAKAAPLPADVETLEDLFLYGLHMEQYRHATYEPADYYKEGLSRDSSDIRLNNAYGILLFKRGLFAESETYLRRAVNKMTRSNSNPYDGEPFYHLGLTLKFQGKIREAYDNFYKSTWNGAWQDSGFYQLACIDNMNGDYQTALLHIERSIARNYRNTKARNLKTAVLRKMGCLKEAIICAEETLRIDVLDMNSRQELAFVEELGGNKSEAEKLRTELDQILGGNHNTYIEIVIDYMEAGMLKEAMGIIDRFIANSFEPDKVYPMIYFYKAFILSEMNRQEDARAFVKKGEETCSDYCFPHRLEDILVLSKVIELMPEGSKHYYYLGNLWYDKKQYEAAMSCWEASKIRNDTFPTVFRNLALAYYNKQKEETKALEVLEKAYALDETDSRVLMELDQLYKKTGKEPADRLTFLSQHMEQVKDRDDLYVEYVTILNSLREHEKALQMIGSRKFHPWEGGEGKVSKQYITGLVELAKQKLELNQQEEAITLLLKAAGSYPDNLGEGKLFGAQENNVYYYLGCVYKLTDQQEKANGCLIKASTGLSEPVGMMYYNDQPPEMIFYQGMALKSLGRLEEASSRFDKLITYGEVHLKDKISIDYFAVSLPDLLIFEEDFNIKNQIHCLFMTGLGHLGKGDETKAKEYFQKVIGMDKNHQGALLYS